MKNFLEIIREANAIPQPENAWSRNVRIKEELRAAVPDREKINEIQSRYEAEEKAEELNEARRKILHHNAKISLIIEYFPAILDVLRNYAGKRIGEKTEQKIESDIHDKTDGNISISFRDTNITIYPKVWNISTFPIYIKAGAKIFDSDGKLNSLTTDMFDYESEDEYIEDIDGYISRKQTELDALNAEISELIKKVSKYNSDLVDSFSRINPYSIREHNTLF